MLQTVAVIVPQIYAVGNVLEIV